MEKNELLDYLKMLKNGILPDKKDITKIVIISKQILQKEANIIKVAGNTYVFGDIHGQFYDLVNMLEGLDPEFNIVFLGDYVDRGYNSLEVILYITVLKILNPSKIIILRGNHENRAQTAAYGFKDECMEKFDEIIYWSVCNLFNFLPIAAIVNSRYFCIHGGISPNIDLEDIISCDRIEELPSVGDILWSDPSVETKTFKQSQRGAGYLFGAEAVDTFLNKVECKYLVRSHQLVFDGIQENFNGKCITVWSAPNYCYKCKNIGAVMVIENDNHKYLYFKEVENQYRESVVSLMNFK